MRTLIVIFICLSLYGCTSSSQTQNNDKPITQFKITYFKISEDKLIPLESLFNPNSDSCNYYPTVIQEVKPSYLPIAIRAGVQGDVVVNVWVKKNGEAYKCQIERTDADLFNKDAIDAVMQWRFSPLRYNCNDDEFVARIPIGFRLIGKFPKIILP